MPTAILLGFPLAPVKVAWPPPAFEKSAFSRFALLNLAPASDTELKFALDRFASEKFAEVKLAEERLTQLRFALDKSAFPRFAPVRFASNHFIVVPIRDVFTFQVGVH